jgi:hypothetical protein
MREHELPGNNFLRTKHRTAHPTFRPGKGRSRLLDRPFSKMPLKGGATGLVLGRLRGLDVCLPLDPTYGML